jgi:hypothetical protein
LSWIKNQPKHQRNAKNRENSHNVPELNEKLKMAAKVALIIPLVIRNYFSLAKAIRQTQAPFCRILRIGVNKLIIYNSLIHGREKL